jgi:hypothetical protein
MSIPKNRPVVAPTDSPPEYPTFRDGEVYVSIENGKLTEHDREGLYRLLAAGLEDEKAGRYMELEDCMKKFWEEVL